MTEKIACRRLSLEGYPRRAQFEYFRGMAYPYTGVTVNVDITRLRTLCRDRALPFFLTLNYQVSRAANAVPELRRRIDGDGIVEYDWCLSSHTVARENGTYAYCTLDSRPEFEDYLAAAVPAQEAARLAGDIAEEGEAQNYLFISTLPWLSYTALVQAVPTPADSNPRISWGRFFDQDGHILIPMTLLCNHALADGLHIARFYEELKRRLDEV